MESHLRSNFLPEPWYEFEDAEGISTCSPDGILVFDDRVFVLEVTHRFHTHKSIKISNLYMPLASEVYSRPVVGVQVFKHPAGEVDDLLVDLESVLNLRPGPMVYSWLWDGF